MAEQERRKHLRHELRVQASISTEDLSIPVVVTNISEEGVQLESDTPIEDGTSVVLSLQLAEETLLNGEVVWLLDAFVDDKMIYVIGMEIEEIALPEIQAIGLVERAEMIQEIISWFEKHSQQ